MTTPDRIRALLDAPPDDSDAEAVRRWMAEFDETLGCHDPAWLSKVADKIQELEDRRNDNETV